MKAKAISSNRNFKANSVAILAVRELARLKILICNRLGIDLDFDLWNDDAGVGLEANLTKTVALGLEYKDTNFFKADSVDLSSSGFGLLSANETLNDIRLLKNEVTASVGDLL